MTDEIQKEIAGKQASLREYTCMLEEKKAQYNTDVQRLDAQYIATREEYAKMDREAELERQKENAEIVAAATAEREKKIAGVQAQYEKDKEQLAVNF